MTDETAHPIAPEPDLSRERARIEPGPSGKSADLLPGLYLLGLIVLAVAVYFLWTNPPPRSLSPEEASKVDTVNTQLASMRDEVAALRNRPTPQAGPSQADFDKLQQQVQELAKRPEPPSLQPIETRLSVLERQQPATPEQMAQLSGQVIALARQMPDLAPLQGQFNALQITLKQLGDNLQSVSSRLDDTAKTLGEAQKDTASRLDATRTQLDDTNKQLKAQADDLSRQIKQVADQVQAIAPKLDQLAQSSEQANQSLGARVDALDQQSKQTVEQVQKVAQRAQLAARLQGVATSLAAGHKLGDLPGAPPALARFANEDPPTEAALRGSFDTYAQKAEAASKPQTGDNTSFGDRLLARAQQSVTVRQGDRVLVGDPIAGVLAHARELLDNGDLSGAVTTVKQLPQPAADAMQPWIDKAQSLLDARAAIATMAAS